MQFLLKYKSTYRIINEVYYLFVFVRLKYKWVGPNDSVSLHDVVNLQRKFLKKIVENLRENVFFHTRWREIIPKKTTSLDF